MLNFNNPLSKGTVCHSKLIEETLKLRAGMVESIIKNELDETIDTELLLRLLNSIDSTALTAMKITTDTNNDVALAQAKLMLREILSNNIQLSAPDNHASNGITIDSSCLPDIELTEGELHTGVDPLNVSDFIDD